MKVLAGFPYAKPGEVNEGLSQEDKITVPMGIHWLFMTDFAEREGADQ